MKIDLHLHSSYSFDSTNEVEEILKMAKENNFSYLAICDHNVTKGNIEAKDNDLGIKIISGIEIDCFFHDGDIRKEQFEVLSCRNIPS